MKRTELPPRRKPLARNSKPIPRVSARRRHAKQAEARNRTRSSRDEIREAVFRRDRRCRLERIPGAGRCAGPLTPHHRRKSGQGGGYTMENLVALCAHHNDRLEADADLALLARTMGLVLKRGDEWTEAHDRFWALVRREGPIPEYRPELGPCWLWMGTTRDGGLDGGYGRWRPSKGAQVYVHRFALSCVEALVDGMEVDHLCRVRLCCNPRHLEQVTPAENRRRQAEARPRPSRCRKDLHDMTDENTILPRPGHYGLECRACKAIRQAASYQRRKQRA